MNKKQPGSINCFVCGRENPVGLKLSFYTIQPGYTQAKINIPKDYEGYPGIVHGGIIAAILDETGGRAYMDDPNHFMVTGQLNVRYRKPVPIETPLIALGFATESRGHVNKARSEIRNSTGEILADAELLLVDIPEGKLPNVNPEILGWRVYDDQEE